ncbi:MAG: YhbY family RNA-binding protein [Polyangiales bacterium]
MIRKATSTRSAPSKGQRNGPSRGQRSGPSRGQFGGPSRGQFGGPSRGQFGGPSQGQRSAPVKAPRARSSEPDASAPARPDTRPAPKLLPREARELRAKAHALEPLVHVGHAGVTEAVALAVRAALRDHELIKVRLHEPEDKRGMATQLAEATRSALCGLVGHTVILYRPRPKQKGPSGVARSSIRRNQPKPRAGAQQQ